MTANTKQEIKNVYTKYLTRSSHHPGNEIIGMQNLYCF